MGYSPGNLPALVDLPVFFGLIFSRLPGQRWQNLTTEFRLANFTLASCRLAASGDASTGKLVSTSNLPAWTILQLRRFDTDFASTGKSKNHTEFASTGKFHVSDGNNRELSAGFPKLNKFSGNGIDGISEVCQPEI